MIALDTNVLVRLLVDDDPEQGARARARVARALDRGEDVFVSDVVVCELVWVLDRSYRFGRQQIGSTLRALRGARHIVFASNAQFDAALESFDAGQGDLADYVIREHAVGRGCDETLTFDGALLCEPGFAAP